MNTFAIDLKKEIANTKNLIVAIEEELAQIDKGFLKCRKTLKGSFFYECDACGNRVGEPGATSDDRVKEISKRVYLQEELRVLRGNLKVLCSLFGKYQPCDFETVVSRIPRVYREGLQYSMSADTSGEESLDGGEIRPSDNPAEFSYYHITADGTMVRSLAELIIYNTLLKYNLRFHYEKKLKIRSADGYEEVRYPDFTIETAEGDIYWEHVGMYGSEDYRNSFEKKLKLYYDNGITPGTNLILTFPTGGKSIDSRMIERIVSCIKDLYPN